MNKSIQLSAEIKKSITSDWAKEFPTLAIYRPMRLLKRHGPLLLGVALDRTSSNDVYIPSFHVHNLLAPSSAITLSLNLNVPNEKQPRLRKQIKISHHQEEFSSAAAFLRTSVHEIEATTLTWESVSKLYADFIRQKRDYAVARYCSTIFQDIILLASWLGKTEYANDCLIDSIKLMRNWNNHLDIDLWEATVKSQMNSDNMKINLESELTKHKLQRIPNYTLDSIGQAEIITDVYVDSWK